MKEKLAGGGAYNVEKWKYNCRKKTFILWDDVDVDGWTLFISFISLDCGDLPFYLCNPPLLLF